MKHSYHCLPVFLGTLLSVSCLFAGLSQAATPEVATNPIGQVARIFNKQLVKLEERESWLDDRISSLASHREQSLKSGLGARGGRMVATDPDPSFTLDLGQEFPLESIFLIPSQLESADDSGLFPRRFTIELSKREDFGQRLVLYTSGATPFPSTGGKPVRFSAHDTTARFVRLTVHQGNYRGGGDLFALSEMVVISKGDPVSFGATVTGHGMLAVPGIWGPEFLVDGRSPLGVWQSGPWGGKNRGELIDASVTKEVVSWSIDLDQEHVIDRVILFPEMISNMGDSAVLPSELLIEIQNDESEPTSYRWTNPFPGTSQISPLVIPFRQVVGSRVQVTSIEPWKMGALKIHALSELEIWSEGKNIAASRPVVRAHQGVNTFVQTLTDGFAAERQIIPVASWLNQLHERWRLESELQSLKPIRQEMASESELNATWGSAVMLGLTFLIPVFIVERRRLINRDYLDSLRKRIASDLHDDIGSNLGSISLIARTAQKDLVRLQGPQEVAEDLGEVESIARESSLAMRDIVWLLERRADSIGDLVQRMRDTAHRLLRDVEYSIECDSCKAASKLSLDAKRHLFLFYKEAIHNIFKHSRATRVSVRLWDVDDKLALEICDNGIGFKTDVQNRPASVHKLEERARVLDGQLDVVSVETKGTSIRLTVKRSHLIVHTSIS